MPRWQAGAHIRVALPDGGDRPYSLMALPGLPDGALALGVLREEAVDRRLAVHACAEDRRCRARRPRRSTIFVCMREPRRRCCLPAASVSRRSCRWRPSCSARGNSISPALCGPHARAAGVPAAVAGDLRQKACPSITTATNSRLDIAAALGDAAADSHVYVCGPAGMIDAVKAAALAKGIPADRIHYELFKAEQPASPDTAVRGRAQVDRAGRHASRPARPSSRRWKRRVSTCSTTASAAIAASASAA